MDAMSLSYSEDSVLQQASPTLTLTMFSITSLQCSLSLQTREHDTDVLLRSEPAIKTYSLHFDQLHHGGLSDSKNILCDSTVVHAIICESKFVGYKG